MGINETPGNLSRFAVFSDVHANLPALDTFLRELDAGDYQASFCLGDLVGYGAHPNECCQRIIDRRIPTVMGNHDFVSISLTGVRHFNEIARVAVEWTHKDLTPFNKEYLSNLPYVRIQDDFTFVHSSPLEPAQWHYILTRAEARVNFDAFDNWICFIGHSHQPFIVEESGGDLVCPEPTEIELDRRKRYIVNVGSIGQPRDHNPDLCYVSVDLKENRLCFHRVAYPLNESRQAILDAGLPGELADRLSMGW